LPASALNAVHDARHHRAHRRLGAAQDQAAGVALVDDQRKTPITVKIDQLFANPVSVAVKYDGSSSITFVPGVPIPVDYSTSEKLTEAPDGLRPVGFIRFRERATATEALRVLLDIGA